MADAPVSEAGEAIHVGSSPIVRTKKAMENDTFSIAFFYPNSKFYKGCTQIVSKPFCVQFKRAEATAPTL